MTQDKDPIQTGQEYLLDDMIGIYSAQVAEEESAEKKKISGWTIFGGVVFGVIVLVLFVLFI